MPPDDHRPPPRALDRAEAGADGRMFAPSAARNGEELLPVLRRVFPASASILEIGSGTGQHAAYFAARMPGWTWIPTDVEDSTFASIGAWCAEAGVTNVAAPRILDVMEDPELAPACDGILAVNVLHIAPVAAITGIARVAARRLRCGGRMALYGPFLFDDRANAPSNVEFDQRLRRLDARFGVRSTSDVERAAESAGLSVLETVPMPHNNTTIVLGR